MLVLTDGLRALAGTALDRALVRFTRSPGTGAAVGALATAVVQSSSATTVAAVGFASAGILRFSQALGIVFGANLGTTVTGWLVVLLGFKLKIGLLALPLVLVGTLLRLFASRRTADLGYALAGFGLVFVGIDMLQQGMSGLAGAVEPGSIPGVGLGNRLLLVGVGAGLTVLTQSSSAGVAMAVAAVSAGAIGFGQAGALVIGMDVGTTATAALATIGGSTAARRTGTAHVVYNLLTACFAFFLLDAFVWAMEAASPGWLAREPELGLVAFHSLFNGLGVVAVLPVAGRFASLIERMVPARADPFSRRLDRGLLGSPEVALAAARPAIEHVVAQAFLLVADELEGRRPDRSERVALLAHATGDLRRYLEELQTVEGGAGRERHLRLLHAVDHLERLLVRTRRLDASTESWRHPLLSEDARGLAGELRAAAAGLGTGGAPAPEDALRGHWQALEAAREDTRRQLVEEAAGARTAGLELDPLDQARWLRRAAYHAWRIVHHLEGETGAPAQDLEHALDVAEPD